MDTMTTADTQPSLAEIEAALDAGKLWYQVLPGRYWRLRRNGRTKTWQRPQPGWRIPVKWGFRFAGSVDNADTVERSAPGPSSSPTRIRPLCKNRASASAP